MLTAIVLTLNEQAHLPECLASLAFADALLVFDSFSSDRTVEIAIAAGARVVQRAFKDYAAQRNAALDAVQIDWVLFVDADERVPAQLAQEVRSAIALTDDQQTRLAAALSKATGKTVNLKVVVDPSVLGGLVAVVGDEVIDDTVRTRLDQLKTRI